MSELKDGGMLCYDCRGEPDWYMVHTYVWRAAFPEYPARKRQLKVKWPLKQDWKKRSLHLCFRCLEKRLGRPLSVDDFKPGLPINRNIDIGIMIGEKRSLVW